MSNDLYNDAILREAKAGAALQRLPDPDATVTLDNPLCGDRVTLDVKLADGRIAALGQKTRGCLLTQAAAALIARRGVGLDRARLDQLTAEVEAALHGGGTSLTWEELAMFRPLQAVKSRHECVRLPFEALSTALDQAAAKTPPTGA